MAAVRLGSRAPYRRASGLAVLRVAGEVAIQSGHSGLGLHPGHAGGLPGHRLALDRRGAAPRTDRQREDGHRRAHRRDAGPAPADGRRKPALRLPGGQVVRCVPYGPESKGGAEATVRIAKGDLVPTDANLLPAYDTFAELADACLTRCDVVNSRRHRAAGQIPADRLDIERTTLHVLPLEPLACWARRGWSARTARSASTQCGTRPRRAVPAPGSGAGWSARNCPSPLSPTPVTCRRSGATNYHSQGFRGSQTRTTPITLTAAASTSPDCSRARKRRSRSWASGREPAAGSRRPDPPAWSVSAPRWPAPSSSPPSWALRQRRSGSVAGRDRRPLRRRRSAFHPGAPRGEQGRR